MKLALLAAAGALAASAAVAQPAATAPAEPRVNQLIVYGNDPCPQSSDEEIVVCARRSENDRFRIPENLRDSPNDPRNRTWTDKAIELSYVGRSGINSCSPVGAGGATGCFEQFAAQWRAERGGDDSVNWSRLIEEARQERLSRIDAEAEAVERESNPPQ